MTNTQFELLMEHLSNLGELLVHQGQISLRRPELELSERMKQRVRETKQMHLQQLRRKS